MEMPTAQPPSSFWLQEVDIDAVSRDREKLKETTKEMQQQLRECNRRILSLWEAPDWRSASKDYPSQNLNDWAAVYDSHDGGFTEQRVRDIIGKRQQNPPSSGIWRWVLIRPL